MALGAAYEEEAITALANSAVTPAAQPSKASAWVTVPEGIGRAAVGLGMGAAEATAQVLATGADALGSIRRTALASPEQRRQMARTGAPEEFFSSDVGDALRAAGRTFRPDPVTANAAEQVLYQFGRGASKVVGGALLAGPAGVLAAGVEEGITQSDELRQQGVDFSARSKAGAVQGAGLSLAALPVIGQTRLATAGLYAVGGPGGFVAQQALTREILQGAGYDRIAEQFDPFDPVGLAVATLLPAGFAAYGLRQQRLQRATDSLPDLPPRADAVPPADPAAPSVPMPSRPTAVADAVRAYPTEVVDAARVALLAERRAAANPGAPDNLRAMDQHEAALTRAEDQINAGEPVRVGDVAPEILPPVARVPVTETPEFRAWFGDSKVVDGEGRPLVVYHGTARDFDAFSLDRAGDNTGHAGAKLGIYLTAKRELAGGYAQMAARDGGDGQTVAPVYVALRNPKRYDTAAGFYRDADAFAGREADWRAQLEAAGHDGVVVRSDFEEVVAFRPEQIKSAIGNSGRFDPNSQSLTDSGFATWSDQITAAIRELQAQARPTDAPITPQAANPEAAAPARGAGDAQAAASAADAGRAATEVEAAGVKAREAMQAKVITLRKRAAVLQSLRECLNG